METCSLCGYAITSEDFIGENVRYKYPIVHRFCDDQVSELMWMTMLRDEKKCQIELNNQT